jgi:hypothetical protein
MRTSAADRTLFQVRLKGGKVWTGTEQELRTQHPGWIPYAHVVQPHITHDTSDDSDLLTQIDQDDLYDDPHPGRLPNSSVSYNAVPGQKVRYEFRPETTIPRRATAQRTPHPNLNHAPPPEVVHLGPARQRRWSFWLFVGIGMLAMLALWVGLQWLGNWWQLHQDYSTYGYPRTWQTDTVVGHNGDSKANPSHFIFLNLNGHVEVIEFPAGDGTKAKIYIGPTLVTDGGDLIPVTGEFADVNGDGKPDMIIRIQDQRIVFINTGDAFRPLKQGEHVTLPQH